jgi:hypothetical protein
MNQATKAAKHKLLAAMTMQGCPGKEWALKAFAAYKDCADGESGSARAACCQHSHSLSPGDFFPTEMDKRLKWRKVLGILLL